MTHEQLVEHTIKIAQVFVGAKASFAISVKKNEVHFNNVDKVPDDDLRILTIDDDVLSVGVCPRVWPLLRQKLITLINEGTL